MLRILYQVMIGDFMKKLFLLVIILFLTQYQMKSQTNLFERKSVVLSIDYSRILQDKWISNGFNMISLNCEIFLLENLSINYSAGFATSNNKLYGRLPASFVTGWGFVDKALFNYLSDEMSNEEDGSKLSLLAATFLIVMPEGLNYYYNLSQYLSLSVSFNPFRYYFLEGFESPASEIAFRSTFALNENTFLTPHIDFIGLWFDQAMVSLGLSFGLKF